MKIPSIPLLLFTVALGTGIGLSFAALADDEAKRPAAKVGQKSTDTNQDDKSNINGNKGDVAEKNTLDQWKALSNRKREIAENLKTLNQEFAAAKTDGKKTEIQAEFEKLLQEFNQKLREEMIALASTVYEQNPDDVDAALIVMKLAYEANQFERAAEVADKLIAAKWSTSYVVNIAGVSHFAAHHFEQARKILEEADQAGKLDILVGGLYLKPAGDYVEFWKKEQEIRKREAAAEGDKRLPRVLLKTSRGDIELELFENEAPNTVANFISLVEAETYDGTKFHRVESIFMVQGGNPNTKDDDPSNDEDGDVGYTIKCECYEKNARLHFRGSLSMAHTKFIKDTGSSQFFLTHLPTYSLNPDAEQETGYTVFGRVVKGMDIVAAIQLDDRIDSAKVIRKRNHAYKPVVDRDESAEPDFKEDKKKTKDDKKTTKDDEKKTSGGETTKNGDKSDK